jgi:hypothetical protein
MNANKPRENIVINYTVSKATARPFRVTRQVTQSFRPSSKATRSAKKHGKEW